MSAPSDRPLMDENRAADIDVVRLATLLASNEPPTLLDVREPWERDICSLPDSIAVPMAQLPAQIEALPRGRMLVVVCHHGLRSAHAANWLRGVGFPHAVNLTGGLDAWALHIDPEMRRY